MKKIGIIAVLFLFTSYLHAQTTIEGTSNTLNVNITKANYDNGIPMLVTSVEFKEPSGNNLLDGEETAQIVIKITNNGSNNAFDVKADLSVDNSKNISFDKNKVIGDIKPGESKTISFNTRANIDVQNGSRVFNIKFSEFGGFMPAPINYSIGIQKFKAPELVFIEAGIEELQGNGNNIIENGELIKVTLLMQNKGQGIASNASYTININDKNIVSIKSFAGTKYVLQNNLGNIQAGESKNLSFVISVTWNYDGSSTLPIKLRLKESRGKFGGNFPIGLELNKKILAATDMKVKGEYSNNVTIKDVSLSIDIDKNIPVTGIKSPNTYALIIGNEDYTKYQTSLTSESNVEFANRDAEVFKEYCIKTIGVPEANITFRTDAISTQMRQDITWLSNKAKYDPQAKIIFYYSGHGFPDNEKESYIMPVDISGANVTNGIKLSDLYKQLISNNPKQVLVFMDACFSGGGRDQGLLAAKAIKVRVRDNAIVKGNITVFSASSGAEESLFYKEKKHGMFTYYLLKKLQDTKGNVTYGEMIDYLKRVVPSKTEDIYRKTQTPEVNISSDAQNTWRNEKFVK